MSSSHTVQTSIGLPVTTTTETVIGTITIPPENQPLGSDGIAIDGAMTGTAGAGTTAVTIRVRQGTVTGTVVGAQVSSPVTASAGFVMPFSCLDATTSYPAGNTYVVTAQQTGATGNGSSFNVTITTTPSTPLAG
jgi:hypothetical protein